jgi:tRNA modification GTPase TrmE
MYFNDTIAAISTPHGTGGIGILRVSGGMAFTICDKIFKGRKPLSELRTHTVNFGRIIDPNNGEIIDEVLLTKMKAPHTFTREDVVEINCHGGTVVMLRILELLIGLGARLAEPGEFTKRAFLNGRLDLSQAEAVIDLINAKTTESSKAAVAQLEGKLSGKIKEARKKLIEIIAHIEVTVDYPEDDVEEVTGKDAYEVIVKIRQELIKIAEGFDKGRILREGITAVIVGKPNVGKSSLLNEFAGKNRSIVTDIPGTTRDIVEEYVSIKGIPVRLSDTAGIRLTEDPIEKIGVEKAEGAISSADLIIMVLDASRGIDAEDFEIIKKISDKRVIYLINKLDLANVKLLEDMESKLHGGIVVKASMLMGKGIEELENVIGDLFLKGKIDISNEVLVTGVRHKKLLDEAIFSLGEAGNAYECRMPLDMITIDLKNAAQHLGEITGESVSEDVVKEIFSRFCIGK